MNNRPRMNEPRPMNPNDRRGDGAPFKRFNDRDQDKSAMDKPGDDRSRFSDNSDEERYDRSDRERFNRGSGDRRPDSKPKQSEDFSIKYLVNDADAGAIIGKKGNFIHHLQTDIGVKIKLSAIDRCYPGTKERVVLISGEYNKVKQCIDEMFQKLQEVYKYKESSSSPPVFVLIIPEAVAGSIIGKQGSVIRDITRQSGVNIKILQDPILTRLPERKVSIMGLPAKCLNAIREIIRRMSLDPAYSVYTIPGVEYPPDDCFIGPPLPPQKTGHVDLGPSIYDKEREPNSRRDRYPPPRYGYDNDRFREERRGSEFRMNDYAPREDRRNDMYVSGHRPSPSPAHEDYKYFKPVVNDPYMHNKSSYRHDYSEPQYNPSESKRPAYPKYNQEYNQSNNKTFYPYNNNNSNSPPINNMPPSINSMNPLNNNVKLPSQEYKSPITYPMSSAASNTQMLPYLQSNINTSYHSYSQSSGQNPSLRQNNQSFSPPNFNNLDNKN